MSYMREKFNSEVELTTDSSESIRKTRLAQAVSSATAPGKMSRSAMIGLMLGGSALVPGIAAAQSNEGGDDAAFEPIEEVVVTGIRSSLRRAVDQKRNASGVVDAISATDIGAFPDTNLAESLQRITGVSIDRTRGEGSKVTVRGFGPSFNLVTLNGRQMPTANGDDRSFDFADLASEGIAGVQIYKSGNADVPSGGIGSAINIQTTKPLESPGFKSVISAKAVFDTSTELGDDVTPEISGIYSNTFADDTFGIAISGSFQERDSGENSGTVGDYNNFLGVVNNDWGGPGVQQWGGIPNNADQANRPGASDIYAVPQSIGYELAEFSRERLNGQITLQWDPNENVRATVDYTYSEVDFERTFNNYSGWFNFGAQVTEYTDGPIASPVLYQENGAAIDFAMAAGRDGVVTENNSIGFNLDWQVNDRLNMEFDFHSSDATSGPSGDNGTASQLAIASFTRDVTRGIFDGDLPILNLDLANPLNANDLIVTGSVFDTKKTEMEIEQATARGTFDWTDTTSIDFGIQLTEVDNRSQFSNVQRDTWGGTTQPGDIADLLTPASAANAFDQISNGNDPRRQTDFFVFDIDAVAARTESLGATQSTGGDCGTGLCPSSNFTTDRITLEETNALYVQLNHDRFIGELPVNIKFGLRYEETDVDSRALVPAYSNVVISCLDGAGNPVLAGCNEFSAIQAVDSSGQPIQEFTRLTGKYDHILPNLDIKVDLSENLVARFSYSETVTRPNFTDIQGGLTIDSLIRISGGNGNAGNPELLPFESENIDLSLEYYFGDTDYASLGYFTKDVTNFIGTSILQDRVLFPGLIHPATGAPVTFDVTAPVNQEDATIDGFEIAVQKTFGDTGFGIIANATFVDADVGFDNNSLEEQFALNGLSDSANLILFYENEKIQSRLAYNWRDDFFNGVAGASSGTPGPVNVESYGQWDISASYDVNENLTVFFEGLNLTEETTRAYGRDIRQVTRAGQTGARYNLGIRYGF
ncbi:MAG: TonB-dependent receptor [Pseudomonadota bacterium]